MIQNLLFCTISKKPNMNGEEKFKINKLNRKSIDIDIYICVDTYSCMYIDE